MRNWYVAFLTAIAISVGGLEQAKADLILGQAPPDGGYVISQVFPDFQTLSTMAFDDFAISQTYSLTSLTALGTELGDPSSNLAITTEIWNGLPGTGSLVQAFSGSEDDSGSLNFNLGGYVLPAGSYWLTAYVTRPLADGQWFLDTFTPVGGSEAQLYNPGGGIGSGVDPLPISEFIDGFPSEDLSLILSGDAVGSVPEPATVTMLGMGVASMFGYGWRRRKAVVA